MRYDFECTECENKFEVSCRLDERELPHPCPECESEKTEQLLSVFAIGDSVRLGITQPSDGWKDRLKHIHKSNHRSSIGKTSRYI